ncbi:cytochrome P450 [Apiospora aurea]|uniref:Cytochrome P450 n=1 Tax=Apiospora aurea TaxID=335848 RepID=A0ABR1QH73_9PEZI
MPPPDRCELWDHAQHRLPGGQLDLQHYKLGCRVLRNEFSAVLGQGGDVAQGWTKAKVASLTRADSVARETLRLGSFGNRFQFRKGLVDNVVTEDSVKLPRGALVSMLAHPAHRDAEFLNDPAIRAHSVSLAPLKPPPTPTASRVFRSSPSWGRGRSIFLGAMANTPARDAFWWTLSSSLSWPNFCKTTTPSSRPSTRGSDRRSTGWRRRPFLRLTPRSGSNAGLEFPSSMEIPFWQ